MSKYGPYLTIAEINAKYPNELVLLANPTHRRGSGWPTGGYVVLHAPDRAEFDRQFDAWDDPEVKHLANHWTGEIQGPETFLFDPEPESGAA